MLEVLIDGIGAYSSQSRAVGAYEAQAGKSSLAIFLRPAKKMTLVSLVLCKEKRNIKSSSPKRIVRVLRGSFSIAQLYCVGLAESGRGTLR